MLLIRGLSNLQSVGGGEERRGGEGRGGKGMRVDGRRDFRNMATNTQG